MVVYLLIYHIYLLIIFFVYGKIPALYLIVGLERAPSAVVAAAVRRNLRNSMKSFEFERVSTKFESTKFEVDEKSSRRKFDEIRIRSKTKPSKTCSNSNAMTEHYALTVFENERDDKTLFVLISWPLLLLRLSLL